jgi:hypothetical protein
MFCFQLRSFDGGKYCGFAIKLPKNANVHIYPIARKHYLHQYSMTAQAAAHKINHS